MNSKIDQKTNDYFDFLASTLSISNVISSDSGAAEKETSRVKEAGRAASKNTADFFSFLSRTLSIATVIA